MNIRPSESVVSSNKHKLLSPSTKETINFYKNGKQIEELNEDIDKTVEVNRSNNNGN